MNSMQKRMDNRYTSLLIWGIPKGLKKRFKAACKRRGASMKEVITKAMERYIMLEEGGAEDR